MKRIALPVVLACFLCILALLSNRNATDVYAFLLAPFFANPPAIIATNYTLISNVCHVIGFSVLAAACRLSTDLRVWQVLVVCFALVVSIELIQAFIPYRQGGWDDVGFGMVGVFLGLVLFAVFRWVKVLFVDRKS